MISFAAPYPPCVFLTKAASVSSVCCFVGLLPSGWFTHAVFFPSRLLVVDCFIPPTSGCLFSFPGSVKKRLKLHGAVSFVVLDPTRYRPQPQPGCTMLESNLKGCTLASRLISTLAPHADVPQTASHSPRIRPGEYHLSHIECSVEPIALDPVSATPRLTVQFSASDYGVCKRV